jgi:hypothetical protein
MLDAPASPLELPPLDPLLPPDPLPELDPPLLELLPLASAPLELPAPPSGVSVVIVQPAPKSAIPADSAGGRTKESLRAFIGVPFL